MKNSKGVNCQKEKNLKSCPCTYPGCPRKGICCECIRHHLNNNELPGCCFSPAAEKSHDRSVKKFISDRQ
jgi:hypothetical protein